MGNFLFIPLVPHAAACFLLVARHNLDQLDFCRETLRFIIGNVIITMDQNVFFFLRLLRTTDFLLSQSAPGLGNWRAARCDAVGGDY